MVSGEQRRPQLPSTLDELLTTIDAARAADPPGGPLTYELADALGALHHCDVGGEPILDVERLADDLLKRYGEPEERRAEVEDVIRRSGLEVGDFLSPNYCSYHAQITSE